MSGYRLHPRVYDDLDDIADYYLVEQRSPQAAERVISDIRTALRNLVPFPHRGHRRTDLTSRPLRFIRVYDYLIAYAPDERPVWVVAVLHGTRDPRILAAILRERE